MRLSSILVYILIISALFALPEEAFAADGNANMNANKNHETTPKHKKEKPHERALGKNQSNGKVNKKEKTLPEQARQIASVKVNQKASVHVNKGKPENPGPPAVSKSKNASHSDSRTSNHGKKMSEKVQGSNKIVKKNGNKREVNHQDNKEQRVVNHQEQSTPETSHSNVQMVENKKKSIVNKDHSADKIQVEPKSQPSKEPTQQPKHRPTHVVLISPPEVPVSGNGGSSGGQVSASFVLKADITEVGRNIRPGQTQFFGSRIEMFRSQWVNAPPLQPPIVAS